MKKYLMSFSLFIVAVTVALGSLYKHTGRGLTLTFAIICGTVAYHFCVRLFIAELFNHFMDNRADCSKKWYQLYRWEERFYKVIRVKQWKQKMPILDPRFFDPAVRTWDEIAQAMCQAELVHETIVPLSFLPVAASVWLGALPVFLITSVFAALFDGLFVVMQRYNRARVVRHLDKTRRKQHLLDN